MKTHKCPASLSQLTELSPSALQQVLGKLSTAEARVWLYDWSYWARPDQLPPTCSWDTWVLLGGRGSGKTRAGAEWIRGMVEKAGSNAAGRPLRIALVAPTMHDAREVMIEGESGLRSICKQKDRPKYASGRRQLRWKSGHLAQVFSAEDADGIRGSQFDIAWCDEFCAWKDPAMCLAMVRMGLRLGKQPKLVVTTTPRPIAALKNLMSESNVKTSHARTVDNVHLPKAFLKTVQDRYGGTLLGRQELGGELIEDPHGGLWSRRIIENSIAIPPPDFSRIVVAVDPPASAGARADACGIVVVGAAGEGSRKVAWILDDRTVQGLRPAGWSAAVQKAWQDYEADQIVAEANQGGEMVRTVLQLSGCALPITLVHARRGKRIRAEPVASLYEQGRVRHARRFEQLEDEMCSFGTDVQRNSPDRLDAMVWGVWALILQGQTNPRLRVL